MASLLFLAPRDLGETVLATAALGYKLNQGDSLVIVCAPEAAALFRAAPGLSRIYTPSAGFGGAWRLWRDVARTRFDLLIDARGGWLGRLTPAMRRAALKPAALVRHRVEEWAQALAAERPLAPQLWLDQAARAAAAALARDGAPLLVLAPGGVTQAKRWAPERFAAVARRLDDGPLAGGRIAVLGAAPRDAEITRAMVASLDADGVAAMDLGGGLDLLAAAALLERATLCIGNDNALTHIAAAVGASTLTLFGPTEERVRAPYGPRTRTLRGRSLAEALSGLDARAAMEDLSIDAVETAALDLLQAGGLR